VHWEAIIFNERSLPVNHIIDSIGKWGVKTTPHNIRMYRPKPGDVIDFGENEGTFPFYNGRYGRIESIDSTYVEGKFHVCCGGASVFLFESGNCSISGGPFTHIDPADLIPTPALKTVRFWNWGDNGRGAGMGVDYYIARPVFKLRNLKA
jgi:hypothetical protein